MLRDRYAEKGRWPAVERSRDLKEERFYKKFQASGEAFGR